MINEINKEESKVITEKVSDLEMVESELRKLKDCLSVLRGQADRVLSHLVKSGVREDVPEEVRNDGENRLDEIRLVLKSDCKDHICTEIERTLSEIEQMIK